MPRVDALREQVQRERDDVDVARPLAVAEERPLDPLRARHQAELGGRDGRAAVVVRMDAEDEVVARGDVPLEPLEPVGVDVRRERLDRRREVEDHPLLLRRAPLRHHRLADLERVVELGPVEALRRVLEHDLGPRRAGELLAERRAADGELGDALACRGGRRRAAAWPTSSCRGARSRAGRPRSPRRCARSAPAAPASARRSSCPPGCRSSSISCRTKSKSVFDADGNPTSISLMPSVTSRSNIFCLRAASIGLIRDWLPSRRSVEHQIGCAVDHAVGPGAVGQLDAVVGLVLPVGHGHRRGLLRDGLLPAVRERRVWVCRRVRSPSGEGGGQA